MRSKLRIEARQWVMARLDPQLWGDRQEVHVKDDWALLTIEERERKADEIIQMVRDIEALEKYTPKPIEYRWAEDDETQQTGGIGR
jgi:hypothetical protein